MNKNEGNSVSITSVVSQTAVSRFPFEIFKCILKYIIRLEKNSEILSGNNISCLCEVYSSYLNFVLFKFFVVTDE